MTERRPEPRLEAYRPRDERIGEPPSGLERPPLARAPRAAVPARSRSSRRRGGGWIRGLAWTVFGLAALIAAAVGLGTAFVPVDLVRNELVRTVKARTGRDLVIAGKTSLSLLPSLAVTMEDVTLSGPPGMSGASLARVKRIAATASVLALLQRKVAIDAIELIDAVIDLRSDGDGRNNWTFGALDEAPSAHRVQLAQAQPAFPGRGTTTDAGMPSDLEAFVRGAHRGAAEDAPSQQVSALAGDVSIGEIRLVNASLRYHDERTGTDERIDAVNANLHGRSLASPVEAKGDLSLRGERVEFDTRVSTPKALAEHRPARLTLALASPRFTTRYDGTVVLARGPRQLDGALRLDTPSVRQLAAWAGLRLQENGGLGPLAFRGDVKSGPAWLAVSNAEVKLDDNSATGSVNLDIVGGRPLLKANLHLGPLQLDRYLSASALQPADRAPPGTGPEAGASPTIGDLIRRNPVGAEPVRPGGMRVKGALQTSGWSEDPIDLRALSLLDADLDLVFAGITRHDLRIGATRAVVTLRGGSLKTSIEDMRLYDGQARGIVTLDAARGVPAVGANLTLEGVGAEPLLRDAAQLDFIAGKSRAQVALGGQGVSQRAIMESLNGKIDVALIDGEIVGFDVGKIVNGIGHGRIGGLERNPVERTPFSEAGATFQVKSGVAETKDLRLVSTQMRVAGSGTIGIGQRQVDLVLHPKLAAPVGGPAGLDLSAIDVPLRVRGSWERPQIAPDVDAVLKDPNKAMATVKEVAKQLQGNKELGSKVRGFLDKFLGPGAGPPPR